MFLIREKRTCPVPSGTHGTFSTGLRTRGQRHLGGTRRHPVPIGVPGDGRKGAVGAALAVCGKQRNLFGLSGRCRRCRVRARTFWGLPTESPLALSVRSELLGLDPDASKHRSAAAKVISQLARVRRPPARLLLARGELGSEPRKERSSRVLPDVEVKVRVVHEPVDCERHKIRLQCHSRRVRLACLIRLEKGSFWPPQHPCRRQAPSVEIWPIGRWSRCMSYGLAMAALRRGVVADRAGSRSKL